MFHVHKRFTQRAIHAAIEPLAPPKLLSTTIVGQTPHIVVTAPSPKIVFAAEYAKIWLSKEPLDAKDSGPTVIQQSGVYR